MLRNPARGQGLSEGSQGRSHTRYHNVHQAPEFNALVSLKATWSRSKLRRLMASLNTEIVQFHRTSLYESPSAPRPVLWRTNAPPHGGWRRTLRPPGSRTG